MQEASLFQCAGGVDDPVGESACLATVCGMRWVVECRRIVCAMDMWSQSSVARHAPTKLKARTVVHAPRTSLTTHTTCGSRLVSCIAAGAGVVREEV